MRRRYANSVEAGQPGPSNALVANSYRNTKTGSLCFRGILKDASGKFTRIQVAVYKKPGPAEYVGDGRESVIWRWCASFGERPPHQGGRDDRRTTFSEGFWPTPREAQDALYSKLERLGLEFVTDTDEAEMSGLLSAFLDTAHDSI